MGWLFGLLQERYDERRQDAFGGSVMMISGCEDEQTSADVSNVESFELPDPAGRAGGACTSVLLNVLYADHQRLDEDLSFVEVLMRMREVLSQRGYTQIPQLTSSHPIDVNQPFDLVPHESYGTRRALLIGINYVGHSPGELSGCHNDVFNMIEYIKDVHGFQEENTTILLDDGEHAMPTKDNIMAAYRQIVEESEPGDAVFLHYSGHGCRIPDDNGDEEDGYDEALVPVDYQTAGVIRDDDIFETVVRPLKEGVVLTALMDCCHSGTVMDLPYIFKANGEQDAMYIDEGFDFDSLFMKLGAELLNLADEL